MGNAIDNDSYTQVESSCCWCLSDQSKGEVSPEKGYQNKGDDVAVLEKVGCQDNIR